MSEPRTRLDQAMTARSLELKKRWVKIAQEAGITTSALSGIRRGEYKPSPHTARALEDALRWEHGSIESILDGGDPTPRLDRHDYVRPQDDISAEREPTLHELAEQMRAMRAEIEALKAQQERDRESRHLRRDIDAG